MNFIDNNVREVLMTEEFDFYYQNLDERTKNKYDYAIQIIKTIKIVSEKFVKKIQSADFYEVRISIGSNEHRTMLIAVDNPNFIEATRVVLLNSFLKKDNKQYKREVEKAKSIIRKLEE